jgi:hypothetical protein
MIFSSLTPWRTHPSSPLPSEKTRKEREAKMQLLVSDAYQWREGGCGQYRSSQFKDGDLNPEEPSPFLFSKPMTLLFFQSTYPIPKKVLPLGSISPKRRYKALRIDPRKVIHSRKPVQSLIQIDCPFFAVFFVLPPPQVEVYLLP